MPASLNIMSIKIFLPSKYFYLKQPCNLYGQLHISEDNVVVYYVLDVDNNKPHSEPNDMRYLGSILCSESYADSNYCRTHDMMICFTYNSESSNISLIFTGITPENLKQIKLILYDKHVVRGLVIKGDNSLNNWTRDSRIQEECDFYLLARLIQPEPQSLRKSQNLWYSANQLICLIANLPMQLFKYIVGKGFINNIIAHTVMYKHFKEWQAIYEEG